MAPRVPIDEFTPAILDRLRRGDRARAVGVEARRARHPRASAVLERGATKLGWRAVEFPRVFRHDDGLHRGVKQTMARTLIPRAVEASGARLLPDTRVVKLVSARRPGRRGHGPPPPRRRHATSRSRSGPTHVFVCGGAIQTPALLQRSGIRHRIGSGLKLHPTIKIAARFPQRLDHDEVPMHRVTEFAPEPHDRRLGEQPRATSRWPSPTRRRTTATRSPTGSA